MGGHRAWPPLIHSIACARRDRLEPAAPNHQHSPTAQRELNLRRTIAGLLLAEHGYRTERTDRVVLTAAEAGPRRAKCSNQVRSGAPR